MLFILPEKGRSQFCPLLNYSFSHIVRIGNVVAHALARRAFFLCTICLDGVCSSRYFVTCCCWFTSKFIIFIKVLFLKKKKKKRKEKRKKVMNKSSCPNIVHNRIVHDFSSNKFRVKSIVKFHFILVDFFS